MTKLFGTAGIRGKYLEKLTPELAYRVGLAIASYAGSRGSATVAHDVRTTSPLLAQLVAAGLMAGGLDSIFIGLAPTPTLAYSVPHTKSMAGVMVTASHNPPEYNGIKVFNRNGMEFSRGMEEELEKIIMIDDSRKLHAPWNSVGRLVENTEIVEEYIRDLVELMKTERRVESKVKVAVDCANGSASNVTPRVLRELGAKVLSINCYPDGLFPGRAPEPRPDVLRNYIDPITGLEVDALMAHDGDADRLALIIPGKGFVKQDLLIALFAKEKLKDRRGTIIVSIDVGKEVEEVVTELGGRVIFSRLGKIHEKLNEIPNALLAAEPWKLIDPEWGPWVDGIYQAAWLVRLSIKYGKTLSELIEELPFYPSARINFDLRDDNEKKALYSVIKEKLIPELLKNYEKTMEMDGIRIEYKDGSWILIRPSGTEPKLRLYMQARERRKLKELIDYMKDRLLSIASSVNIAILSVEEQVNMERTTR